MPPTLYGPPAQTLVILLNDPEEHEFASMERILLGLPAELAVKKLEHWPHSIAEVLAHMNANVQFNLGLIEATDPEGYPHPGEDWPQVGLGEWGHMVEGFLSSMGRLAELARTQPLERILYPATGAEPAWTVGYKLALSVAKHNAYHLGQIVLMRRMLFAWDG